LTMPDRVENCVTSEETESSVAMSYTNPIRWNRRHAAFMDAVYRSEAWNRYRKNPHVRYRTTRFRRRSAPCGGGV